MPHHQLLRTYREQLRNLRHVWLSSNIQGRGWACDAIGNQPRSNDVMMRRACAWCGASSMTPSICTAVALASNAASTRSAQRRGAGGPLRFRMVLRPISTLHGVVFRNSGSRSAIHPVRDTAPSMLRAAFRRCSGLRSAARSRTARRSSGSYRRLARLRSIAAGFLRAPTGQAEIVYAKISDMHGGANPAGVAKYPQIAVDFGRTAGGFLRVVRELHGWPAVDRRYLAND